MKKKPENKSNLKKAYKVVLSGSFFNDAGWDEDEREFPILFSSPVKANEYFEKYRTEAVEIDEELWRPYQDPDIQHYLVQVEVDHNALLDNYVVTNNKFVAVRREWHYNDEHYYHEGEGGCPEHIFDSQEVAQRYADKKNAQSFREIFDELEDYISDGDMDYVDENFLETFEVARADVDVKDVNKLTDSDILEFIKMYTELEVFHVVKVPYRP